MNNLPNQVPSPFTERLAHATLRETPENTLSTEPEPEAKPLEKERPEQISIVDGELKLCNIEAVWRAAKLIRQSGLCPQSFRNDQQLVIAILRCLELKVPIFQGLEGMTVINGKLGIMGDLALALVQASGFLEKKTVEYQGEGDELSCTVILKRKGRAAQSYSFSLKEAQAAGIYDRSATWRSYPKRMVYYRALGFGLRDEFPDVLKGIKTTEELADYPERVNDGAR